MKKEGLSKIEVSINGGVLNDSEKYMNGFVDDVVYYKPRFNVVKKTAYNPHDYFDVSDSVNRNTDDE